MTGQRLRKQIEELSAEREQTISQAWRERAEAEAAAGAASARIAEAEAVRESYENTIEQLKRDLSSMHLSYTTSLENESRLADVGDGVAVD